MSIYRRRLYDRERITILYFNPKKFAQEMRRYKIIGFDSIDTINVNKDLLYDTSNAIILDLIHALSMDFISRFEFNKALDKVITYTNHSDLMELKDVFLKLYSEVVQPYLHIDKPFVALYLSE